jgi:tRNA pseudouridine32 synthase/23S rRNA pseudouridine746 synthase/23S rRNA pseudouridine1911/1915/1917 synthase
MPKKKHSTNRHRAVAIAALSRRRLPRGLAILYEDSDIIVVDKPAGLLTVGTDSNKTRTVHYVLTDYVRKGCAKSRNRIFVVHRLDQWTSGVLVFAKSEEVKLLLQAQWKETEKKYLAVVHGRLSQKEGIITSYLAENKAYVVYSTTDAAKGKLAHTAYKVLKETGGFSPVRNKASMMPDGCQRQPVSNGMSLLEVNLLTGRKNQIRVHLADKGHPIAGDRKYGKAGDGYKRLALHSKSISFKHPTTGRQMTFESPTPSYFNNLMKIK